MEFQHQFLAKGRWFEFSLAEQLGNIGSEISRAIRSYAAVMRAYELFNLTISDFRWRKRLKELTRARELFLDAIWGNNEYKTTLEDLDKYIIKLAIAARLKR